MQRRPRSRRAGRTLPTPLALAFALAVAFGLAQAACHDAELSSWPPRTGRNDALAEASGVSAEVMLVIPPRSSLRMSGRRDLAGAQFVPVEGSFQVIDGELTSALGAVHRSARFGAWSLIHAGPERQQLVGWGPCLTEGELIVPNLFGVASEPGRWVENSFEVEDLGEFHSLIRLDPARGDRFCFAYRPADGQGYSGALSAEGTMTLSGQVDPGFRPDSDRMLFATTGYAGARARVGDLDLELRGDGWYRGERRVGPPEP